MNRLLEKSPKSGKATLLLAVFLGVFGAHRFYVGKKASGLLYLLTLGGFFFGAVVDIILIARGLFLDEAGRLVTRNTKTAVSSIPENQEELKCKIATPAGSMTIESDADDSETIEPAGEKTVETISVSAYTGNTESEVSMESEAVETQETGSKAVEPDFTRADNAEAFDNKSEEIRVDDSNPLESVVSAPELESDVCDEQQQVSPAEEEHIDINENSAAEDEVNECSDEIHPKIDAAASCQKHGGSLSDKYIISDLIKEADEQEADCYLVDDDSHAPMCSAATRSSVVWTDMMRTRCNNTFIYNAIYLMRRYAYYDCPDAYSVPFKQYWPAINDMDDDQKDWYFYWRGNVRKGNYQDTDVSYIFLYSYELLNGVDTGKTDPLSICDKLILLWKNYRHKAASLNKYLFNWALDYAIQNGIVSKMLEKINVVIESPVMTNYLIEKRRKKHGPVKLSYTLILSVMFGKTHQFQKYRDHGIKNYQLIFKKMVPKAVTALDDYYIRHTGRDIFESCGPLSYKEYSYTFYYSALCEGANETVELLTYNYCGCSKLKKLLKQVCSCCERIIYFKYGKEKVTTLKKDSLEWILFNYFCSESDMAGIVLSSTDELELSQKKIEQEKNDSDSLYTGSENKEDGELQGDDDVSARAGETPAHQTFNAVKPEINIDLSKVKRILEEADEVSNMLGDPDEAANGDEQDDIGTEGNAEFDTVIVETAKESSDDDLQDSLNEFVDEMTPIQKNVVRAVLYSSDANAMVEKIARRYGQMPLTIIEKINNMADEYIGDILIDTGQQQLEIFEDYRNILKQNKQMEVRRS